MSALEKVLLAVAAGGSAGTTAGKSAGSPRAAALNRPKAPRPTAHELHVEHVEHVEHMEHLHHEHVLHEEHLAHEAHLRAEGKASDTSARPRKPREPKKSAIRKPKVPGSPVGTSSVPAVKPKTPGPVGLSAVLALAARDEDDATGYLHETCPWFRSVSDGQQAADFRQYCRPATGKAKPVGLEVKLTPRTPEASTVPEPTVPPGGPGLFHIKGRELPPYIQHLWHHLAPKYGKHRAYGMAVGIVKKWAAGINPGGWNTKSGKGKRTHPDVRAAAQRNVAEWEKDKADAHKQSAEHGHG